MNEETTTGDRLPSLPLRAVQVLFAPGALFQALKARPVWFWTMLIMSVLSGLSVWFIPDEAWISFFREQMLETGQTQVPTIGTAFRVFGSLGAAISIFVIQILIACFTFGIFVFLLGDDGAFKQHLSVVAHAGVVSTIGAFVSLPLRISQLDPQLTLSVGTLFPFLPDGYLFNVLQSLDLFGLWAAVLTGLGVSVLDPRRRWSSAALVLIGLSVAFALGIAFFR